MKTTTLPPEKKNAMSVRNMLADKRGFSHLQWAIMILLLVIILIFIVYYCAAVTNADAHRQKAKTALDSYLQQNAIRIYQEVKQGNDYTEKLYVDEYVEYLMRADNLVKKGDKLVSYGAEGTVRYYTTIPEMKFEEDYTPKIIVTYTISMPITFGGSNVTWVHIPMTVSSRFVPKFDTNSANGSGGTGNNIQVKKYGAFAVYYAADQSLRFFKNYDCETVGVGKTYNGGTVTAVFKGFETGSSAPPWSSYAASIKRVEFVDEINPKSTANWFAGFTNCVEINLINLNTSETTNMDNMFDGMIRLEKVIVGPKFSFSRKGDTAYAAILPTPNANYIPNADGYWYTVSGQKYQSTSIPNKAAGIYYAYIPYHTNTIGHWLFGLKTGDGNNSAKNAFSLGGTSFTARYGDKYTMGAQRGVVPPNGCELYQSWQTYNLEKVWKFYDMGTEVTQIAGTISYEYRYYPITYNITYNLDGGTNASSNPSTYNVVYGFTLANPTKTGYTFDGWYIGNTKVTGINESTVSFTTVEALYAALSKRTTGDLIITAKWIKN